LVRTNFILLKVEHLCPICLRYFKLNYHMLCKDCSKNIEVGKEIQVMGSIICSNCNEIEKLEKEFYQINVLCHYCYKEISRDSKDHYTVPITLSFGFLGSSLNIVQCFRCYRLSKLRKSALFLYRNCFEIMLFLFLFFLLILINAGINKRFG
jgi:hypothetical protein